MKFTKLSLPMGFVILLGLPVWAHAQYPLVDFFWGYQYANVDTSSREDGHGWAGSVTVNFHRNLGIALDFDAIHTKTDGDLGNANFKIYSLGVGPRFTLRGERVNAFTHAQIGFAHAKIHQDGSDTGLRFNLGGGLDINVHRNVAFRLVQVDYVPARLAGEWGHNVRVLTGIVLRFGY